MPDLEHLLDKIRQKYPGPENSTNRGTAFENVVKVFLEEDSIQKQQFKKVWHYRDWAEEHSHTGLPSSDTGIDLVAALKDGSGFCVVQCKFHEPKSPISKGALDSFISASDKNIFVRRLLVDTSEQPLNRKALAALDGRKWNRIQTEALAQSNIDWMSWEIGGSKRPVLKKPKKLRDHQIRAVRNTEKVFSEGKQDRGKILMACGTGKTLVALKIAEKFVEKGKLVLYMVPSLALMSQVVREWKNDAARDFTAFSACSDKRVGRISSSDDRIEVSLNDLAFPATTDAVELAESVKKADPQKMVAIFSTYQSIDVISQAQEHGLGEFDLIICDEAHRTTGSTRLGQKESNFVRIHSNKYVAGKRRIYMTATPRVYGENARKQAEEQDVALASMDDINTYGPAIFSLGFNEAVRRDLLSDYKVVALTVSEGFVARHVRAAFSRENSDLKLGDAGLMIGCWKALSKIGIEETGKTPMKRALAFANSIENSERFTEQFRAVTDEYNENIGGKNDGTGLEVELAHVDGTFNAEQRSRRISWLKDVPEEENTCRVLSNVRCLSEGVDVPALDAIIFLHPRKSQVDVVQSVGRVMRKAEGKKTGYVILPIVVPPGASARATLDSSENYRVIWQVLNALRSHDERLDRDINRMALGEDVSNRMVFIDGTLDDSLLEMQIDRLPSPGGGNRDLGIGKDRPIPQELSEQERFDFGDIVLALKAKIVEKCGTRVYWEKWGEDISKIAEQHITRLNAILAPAGTSEQKAFEEFLKELRDDLNPEVSESDAIEMLAQHIVTGPVFDTLFGGGGGGEFTARNSVSQAMQKTLDLVYRENIASESKSLEKFYASVRLRAEGIETLHGRQTLIKELYERFFQSAFQKTASMLGIVYTPVEIVDFIIHSVEDVLKAEFDQNLSDTGIDILDPFVGTGTFITRLMQSGLLGGNLDKKYKNDIHANEIVLLAYYIACINIESAFHGLMKEKVKQQEYQPFEGAVLTDTFYLFEQDQDMVASQMPDNSGRRTRQKASPIKVIIGNPPYSVGQKSGGDNAQNVKYKNLDNRIRETYAAASNFHMKRSLYDSYIRAFRWAADRLETENNGEGIVAFITNAGWITGNSAGGFRKCLVKEFDKIHVFNLRGNLRTPGAVRKKEGGNVFGIMTPVAITILTKKKKSSTRKGQIFYYEIEDYLNKDQKFAFIKNFKSINKLKFQTIQPDKHGNWVNQEKEEFHSFVQLGSKKSISQIKVFKNYSSGIITNRDPWNCNFSQTKVVENVKKSINFYNSEVTRFTSNDKGSRARNFVDNNPQKISWNETDFKSIEKGKTKTFKSNSVKVIMYRPFTKIWAYTDKSFNWSLYQLPKIFPDVTAQNLIIAVPGTGGYGGLCSLMCNRIPSRHMMPAGGNCFPLHLYGPQPKENLDRLFQTDPARNSVRTSAITGAGLKIFQDAFPQNSISEKDLFYHIYGLLHSPRYQKEYHHNFFSSLPRIPLLTRFEDFWTFSQAGRELAKLHVNYEEVEPWQVVLVGDDPGTGDPVSHFRVTKMKFPDKGDRTKVSYNSRITISEIPEKAWNYMVSDRAALEWVMNQQCVKTDKNSGIVSDANDWANETMNNPRYSLELFLKIITVSMKTLEIVENLPDLDIRNPP